MLVVVYCLIGAAVGTLVVGLGVLIVRHVRRLRELNVDSKLTTIL